MALSLLVLAIGAGAMVVSHANDSYFWVVSQFSGLELKEAIAEWLSWPCFREWLLDHRTLLYFFWREILIAPDKFKGTLSASEVCSAIQKEFNARCRTVHAEHFLLLMAEKAHSNFSNIIQMAAAQVIVHDPLMRKTTIIVRSFSQWRNCIHRNGEGQRIGLLKSEESDPLLTTTFGTWRVDSWCFGNRRKAIIFGIGGQRPKWCCAWSSERAWRKILAEDGSTLIPTVGISRAFPK